MKIFKWWSFKNIFQKNTKKIGGKVVKYSEPTSFLKKIFSLPRPVTGPGGLTRSPYYTELRQLLLRQSLACCLKSCENNQP